MRFPKTATFIAMLALAIFAIAPSAGAQSTVGTITQVQGVANIERGAQNIVVITNLPVELHDKITTQQGASLTIGLVDKSSLQLGQNATLIVDESVMVNGFGAPSKLGLLGGKIHSLVVGAMRGPATTFEIHTPNAIGAVRGTEFDTEYTDTPHDDDKGKYKDCRQFTYIDVQDGTVNVCNPQNPAAGCEDVHAGHHTVVACGDIFLDGAGGYLFPYDDALLYGGLGALAIGGTTVGILCATGDLCGGHHHHSSHE